MSRTTQSDRPKAGRPETVDVSPLHEPEPIRELNRELGKAGRPGTEGRDAGDRRTGDLFAWGAKRRQFERTGSLSARPPRERNASLGLERHAVRSDRVRRFRGFYLESGSFGHGEPIDDGNPFLRNRILFFCAVLVMVVFILVKVLGH